MIAVPLEDDPRALPYFRSRHVPSEIRVRFMEVVGMNDDKKIRFSFEITIFSSSYQCMSIEREY